MQPAVTVVIPCHNHARWVLDAVESVVRQTYPNKRITVVDDGSSDGSHQVVLGQLTDLRKAKGQAEPEIWAGRYKDTSVWVMLLRFTKAGGPSAARNHGIKASWEGTDVFAFLDSDDLYQQEKLARSVEKLLLAPQIGVVYSDYDTLRADGLRLRQFKEPYSRERLLRECIVNCDSVVTKKALEECGFFDESLRVVEDFDLWLRISERFLLAHLPESLVTIRVGEHSSTSQVQNEVWQRCYSRVVQKCRERQVQQ